MKIKIGAILLLSVLFLQCKNKQLEPVFTAPAEYDLVILNANVIAIETGRIAKKNLYIIGDRIKLVAPVDSMFDYRSEQALDVNGRFVLPGFWDNHVHFRGGDSLIDDNKKFLDIFLKYGITTVRDAGGDLSSSVLKWKNDINNGSIKGPTIFTSGAKIDGPNPFWAGSIAVNSGEDITEALDSLQSMPVDFVKLYDSTISGNLYLETIRAAEKRGLITSGHMPFSVSLEETVKAGIDGIEHMYYVMKGSSSNEAAITQAVKNENLGLWDAMYRLMDTQDATAKLSTIDLLKETNVFVVPTLYVGQVLTAIPDTDHSQDPELQQLSEAFINTYQRRIGSAMAASAKSRANKKRLESVLKALVNDLNKEGVSLLAGSDCGASNSYVYPGSSLHKELGALVDAGLSPLEALQTSAYNGSRFLKQETNYGTIAVGKIADLVILNKNPLESITNTTTVSNTVYRGKLLKPTCQDTLIGMQ